MEQQNYKVTWLRPSNQPINNKVHYLKRDNSVFQDIQLGDDWCQYESEFSKLLNLNIKIYGIKPEKQSDKAVTNNAANILLLKINSGNPIQEIKGPILIISQYSTQKIQDFICYIEQIKNNIYQEGLSQKKLQVYLKNALKSWKQFKNEKGMTLAENGKFQSIDSKNIVSLQDLTEQEIQNYKQLMTECF